MSERTRRRPGSRIVGYEVRCDVSLEMEIALEKAKSAGTVTEGDCDSHFMWFEGRPGPTMRAFRKELLSLSASPRVPPGTPRMSRLIGKFVRVRDQRQSAAARR